MKMPDTISTDSLMRFVSATPEQRAAIDRFLLGALDEIGSGASRTGEERGARFVFRKAGSRWRVVLDGGTEFFLDDTLGARYLGYLLHHPNQTISAFDLEVAIQPEKAGVRSKNSIQKQADPETTRSYLRELTRLRSEREEAAEAGKLAEADRLDEEIEALGSALRGGSNAGDTGERARSNVNKALAAVRRCLAKGDKAERDFGEHVERFVSVGYQCMYAQPPGGCWE